MTKTAHELVADKVIGAMLSGSANTVLFQAAVETEDYPSGGIYRALHRAALDVLMAGKPLSPEGVFTYLNGALPMDTLTAFQAVADWDENTVFQSCQDLKRLALGEHARQAMQLGIDGLAQKREPQSVIDEVVLKLLSQRGGTMASPMAADAVVLARQRQAEEDYTLPTASQLEFVNEMTGGGLRRDRLIGLGGHEKSRKTTWLRNLFLSLLRKSGKENGQPYWIPRQDVSVALLCFENNNVTTMYDFASMLAVEHAIHKHRMQSSDPLLEIFDGDQYKDAYESKRYLKYDKRIAECFEVGMERYAQMALGAYDRRDAYGNLRTLESMKRVIWMHNLLYKKPGQHLVVAVDFMQMVRSGATIFDRVENVVDTALELVTKLDCTIIVVSQYSREKKKDDKQGENLDVMGTKGGAALEENAHLYMATHYNDAEPHQLNISMPRTRKGAAWKRAKGVRIHPPSGLILE